LKFSPELIDALSTAAHSTRLPTVNIRYITLAHAGDPPTLVEL